MNNNTDNWQSQKSGSCWQITFASMPEYPENLVAFLEEQFISLVCNYHDDGTEEYVAYQEPPFDTQVLQTKARQQNIALPEFTTVFLASDNWLQDYAYHFEPFSIAEFFISELNSNATPPTDKLALSIYASTAFGSTHPTTGMCLQALSLLHNHKFCPSQILDVGTGSGILALAAAKLWTDSLVTAIDIDAEATWVASQNAVRNNLAHRCSITTGDGYNSPAVHSSTPYNLIMANILANPLIAMSSDLYLNLKPGGYCILSGFTDSQLDWIINTHQNLGLKPYQILQQDHWCAVIMEK